MQYNVIRNDDILTAYTFMDLKKYLDSIVTMHSIVTMQSLNTLNAGHNRGGIHKLLIQHSTFNIQHSPLKVYPHSCVEHPALYRSPNQGWLEIASPWVAGTIDRSFLLETSQVLASHIDTPMAEPSRNLRTHLPEAMETRRP